MLLRFAMLLEIIYRLDITTIGSTEIVLAEHKNELVRVEDSQNSFEAVLGNVNPVANDLVDGGLSKLLRYKLKFLTVG